ncbi:hypothetical protein E4V99_02335 [Microbacterium sp. dk485]|uniref:hypothetical protein n=1 Tax=Microbacterium sp. dk485 TaxID=2560021 RepID=UPI0010747636|nr:hypothetical protein [Microbacterium sp. dk485]TFV83940.1 hypothetical protein E4V99_02335 [Microbacterium sp. dk485]
MSESIPTRRAQRDAADGPGAARSGAALADPADREAGHTEWRPAQGIPAATVAAPRRSAAPITSAPVFAPTRFEQPPADAAPARIGWDAGRSSLSATAGEIRPLETAADVLPELEEAQITPRPMWKHPAFLVSAITTLLALIALAVFLVLGLLNPRPAATGLTLDAGDDNVHVSWSGPDVAYQVIVVGGPGGDELDVSQLVTGTEAWIPTGMGFIDDRSCVVVRPAEGNETAEVALDAATVADQGGASACVADD